MFKDLSPSILNLHIDHIPSPSLDNNAGMELLHSVEELGILVPLLVTERAPDDYLIIDGARRYLCAKELCLETVPCRVRGSVKEEDFHLLRWDIHHTYLPWTLEERNEWSKKFKPKG
jgi:ParB-like chromosome segregation protein Spo0J